MGVLAAGYGAAKAGGGALNFGMDQLGLNNDYNQSNPYDPAYLQQLQAQQHETYQNQAALAQMLQAQAAGNGPAQALFNANTEQNTLNNQGLISSQRGVNPALAAKMGSNAQSVGAQQAALGNAYLQQQALGQLGSLYGNMQQGNIQGQDLYGRQNLGAGQINAGVAQGNVDTRQKLIGGIMNAGGGAAQFAAKSAGGGMFEGGYVPGKEVVAGDSHKNDTVPAMLSPGEIVIKKTAADTREKAHKFLDALYDQEEKKKKPKSSYADVLRAKRSE